MGMSEHALWLMQVVSHVSDFPKPKHNATYSYFGLWWQVQRKLQANICNDYRWINQSAEVDNQHHRKEGFHHNVRYRCGVSVGALPTLVVLEITFQPRSPRSSYQSWKNVESRFVLCVSYVTHFKLGIPIEGCSDIRGASSLKWGMNAHRYNYCKNWV